MIKPEISRFVTALCWGGLVTAGSIAAAPQEPIGPQDVRNGALGEDAFRTPIHTRNADAMTGNYGVWTSGDDFKASFHDGFAFYPVLGTAYPNNLPLAWNTESVQVGGVELQAAGAPTTSSTDWRFESRRGPVVERYDVRADGVEQSFVIERLPNGGAGELIVRGRIDTPLEGPKGILPADRARELTFTDAQGNAIVSYGRAIAFDATGRRTDVFTGWTGSDIELRVPGWFVADAQLPLTIDPLVSTLIVSSSGGEVGSLDVGRDDESNQLLVAYTRASSASDYDTWGRIMSDSYTGQRNVFSDVDSTVNIPNVAVAFAGGADRWVIAHEISYSDGAGIALERIRKGETGLNNGVRDGYLPATDTFHTRPSIGGTPGFDSGTKICVAYQSDTSLSGPANTMTSSVMAAVYDCATGDYVNETIRLSNVPSADAETPCVSRVHSGGTDAPWLVTWEENANGSGDAWRARVIQVRQTGGVSGRRFIGSTLNDTVHNLNPKIAGSDGRYAVVYAQRPNVSRFGGDSGRTVRFQRIDWSDTASTGYAHPPVTFLDSPLYTYSLGKGHAIAFDNNTASHWTIMTSRFDVGLEVFRLGFDGGIAERQVVHAPHSSMGRGILPAVCFNDDFNRFSLLYGTDGNLTRIHGESLIYPAESVVEAIGVSCNGSVHARNGAISRPHRGSELFQLELRQGSPATLSYMLASPRLADTPWTLPGNSGCELLLSAGPELIVVAGAFSSSTGEMVVPMPIPAAISVGDIYWQAIQFGQNGLSSSRVLRTAIH